MIEATETSKVGKRPWIATLSCIAIALYNSVLLLLVLPQWEQMVQQYGQFQMLLTVFSYCAVLIGVLGYWKMRRWGIWLCFLAVSVMILSDFRYGNFGNVEMWVQMVMVGIGFAYFKRMA